MKMMTRAANSWPPRFTTAGFYCLAEVKEMLYCRLAVAILHLRSIQAQTPHLSEERSWEQRGNSERPPWVGRACPVAWS